MVSAKYSNAEVFLSLKKDQTSVFSEKLQILQLLPQLLVKMLKTSQGIAMHTIGRVLEMLEIKLVEIPHLQYNSHKM